MRRVNRLLAASTALFAFLFLKERTKVSAFINRIMHVRPKIKPKRTLVVGLVGYNFMGKAHSNAWRQISRFFDLTAGIRLKTICGRDRDAVSKAAGRLGWESFVTDWHWMVDDPEIDIVDICTPNDSHCEIAVAAAQADKAVLCEKPLARNVDEAEKMAQAAKKARVVNMVCHNYRRLPAVALARQMIERNEVGDRIFHFRARYAQDWTVDPTFPLVWRLQSEKAGSGALGDIFSHIVDLARYLIGEFNEVCATMETFVKRRPLKTEGGDRRARRIEHTACVDVDDAVTMIGRFKNGALASIEATRFASGRKNSLTLEINGSAGSLVFDLEEMNHLKFYSTRDPADRQGFRDILVTEPTHPYIGGWWPPGHIIGWEHTFINTIVDFVNAVAAQTKKRAETGLEKNRPAHGQSIEPSFEDGLKTQRLLEAAAKSAETGKWIQCRESAKLLVR
jgi:predicted dehydrogenase